MPSLLSKWHPSKLWFTKTTLPTKNLVSWPVTEFLEPVTSGACKRKQISMKYSIRTTSHQDPQDQRHSPQARLGSNVGLKGEFLAYLGYLLRPIEHLCSGLVGLSGVQFATLRTIQGWTWWKWWSSGRRRTAPSTRAWRTSPGTSTCCLQS